MHAWFLVKLVHHALGPSVLGLRALNRLETLCTCSIYYIGLNNRTPGEISIKPYDFGFTKLKFTKLKLPCCINTNASFPEVIISNLVFDLFCVPGNYVTSVHTVT